MAKNQMKAQRAQDREDNKLVNEQELSQKHRWINLTEKRGDQTCIPFKFKVDSILLPDQKSLNLYLNVSRKFIPIGTKFNETKYFVPSVDDDENVTETKNKWGTKFRDVDKVMAWLCYDQKVHQNEQG